MNAEQRGSAKAAQRANDLQAEANALAAEYHEAALMEASFAREAAEQQAADAARFQHSMWSQSEDGRIWQTWATQAEDWATRASGHDQALLPHWKEAAAPNWQKGPIAQRKKHADEQLGWAKLGLGIGIGGSIVGMILYGILGGGHNPIGYVVGMLTTACNWLVPVAAIAAVIFWVKGSGTRAPLETQVARSDEVQAFVKQYGANPFTNPGALPSWRAGMTRDQHERTIANVLNVSRPGAGFYPRPDQLPVLPELNMRNLDELPAGVAAAARSRFNLA